MKEIEDIIIAYDIATANGLRTALATVVHVEGSSYRRPGARLLITEEGKLTGAISGGCLEGDALRKALQVILRQRPMLVTYDTNDEDDAAFGMGLGCNGIIQVLIEPILSSQADHPIELLKRIAEGRKYAALITLFSLSDKKNTQYGTCALITDDGTIYGETPLQKNSAEQNMLSMPSVSLSDILITEAKDVLRSGNSTFKNYISGKVNITCFTEYIRPAVAMVIFGAGNDVVPLVEMASILGWKCTVIHGKTNNQGEQKLNGSCRVMVSKADVILNELPIDDRTVFLLMSHNYIYDMNVLMELMKRKVFYVGMLGPKKKLVRMIADMAKEGIVLSEDQLAAIYSPVGLDIGAESSEEIALSILAEIKSVLEGRHADFLKHHADVIHDRSATVIRERRI